MADVSKCIQQNAEPETPAKKPRVAGMRTDPASKLKAQPAGGDMPPMNLHDFAKKRGLSPSGAKWLLARGLPIGFFNLIMWAHTMLRPGKDDAVQLVELFSGVARLHAKWIGEGEQAAKYDTE